MTLQRSAISQLLWSVVCLCIDHSINSCTSAAFLQNLF